MSDVPANKRGWGWPGEPNSKEDKAYRASHIVKVDAGGTHLWIRREVAPLIKGFIDELCSTKFWHDAKGHPYRLDVSADDWGYANRDVRGRPGVKSNHAWGLAVDLNSATNPMTEDGRNHTDLPSNVSSLAAKYGLRWGGDYSGKRRDPMHFEFIGTPADAQQRVSRLKSVPRHPRAETNPYREPQVSAVSPAVRGASGDGVKWIEYQLGMTITGVYGESLVRAVNAFQAKTGLKRDGEVGPLTLQKLRTL